MAGFLFDRGILVNLQGIVLQKMEKLVQEILRNAKEKVSRSRGICLNKKNLFAIAALIIIGYLGINLFDYAYQLELLWQRELAIFSSLLIICSDLAWLVHKTNRNNWLWLALSGFSLLLIPLFSVLDLPVLFWIPSLMGSLGIYSYFVNRQMLKVIIALALIGVAVLIFSVIVIITGIGIINEV